MCHRMGRPPHKPEGRWDQQANQMIQQIQQSGHPVFRGTSALNRGTLKFWAASLNGAPPEATPETSTGYAQDGTSSEADARCFAPLV